MSFIVNMGGDMAGFKHMLDEARTQAKHFANEVGRETSDSWKSIPKMAAQGIAGFLTVEGVKSMVEGAFQAASSIKELSEQFDLSTDSVQKWEKGLNKANVSQMVFFRALETLRAKRQEALEDPKKMEPFQALGLAEGVRGGMTDEQLLKAVLQSGGSRSDIRELTGPRGPTLKAALEYEEAAKPNFSEQDIERLHGVEAKGKGFLGKVKAATGKMVAMLFDERAWWISPEEYKAQVKDEDRLAKIHSERLARNQAKQDADEALSRANLKEVTEYAKKEEENEEKVRTATERLRDAKRKNMTTGGRREDVRKELAELDARIRYHTVPEALMTAADKEKLANMKIKREGLVSELREAPLQFSADSMARVGLFSAAAMNFNPSIDIARSQLNELRGIHSTLRGHTDPHHP